MKFKALFFAALAAAFSFVSCQDEKQNLGTPSISISVSEMNFEIAGGNQTLTLNATRDWKVEGLPAEGWVAVSPEKGEASSANQTVTVTALSNPGGRRTAELTFTIGTFTKTLKVIQAGDGTSVGEGDGTEAAPYSASQALELAKAMADGQTKAGVYVQGVIVSITEVNTSFGNATYKIADAAGAADAFGIYRGKYFNGEAFTAADQIKVGDNVVVCGDMVNYKGNTPQLTTGSKIVKLNGETSGSTVTPPADGEGDGGEVTPPSGPVTANAADFNGLTTNSNYVTSTTPSGWVLTNCAIQKYGTSSNQYDQQPFLPEGVIAACINGKTTAVGTIKSPVIAGGCGTLSFSYAAGFSENNGISFKVEVFQNDAVVKTFDVVKTDSTTDTAYSHTEEINVTGNFSLKFTNNSPTNKSDGNKDRYSIWNITWTSKAE